ncbi:DNA polymerase alpha, subunit B, partial [Lichtheimia hyalospora FSU 10163]
MSQRDQLRETFRLTETSHSDIIDELESLLRLYNLSPTDLKFKWEAFSLNLRLEKVAMTVDLIRQLKINLQREFEQQLEQKRRDQAKAANSIAMDTGEFDMQVDEGDSLEDFISKAMTRPNARSTPQSRTPQKPTSIRSLESSRTSTSFAQRMAGNTIEEQCNPHLPLRQPITDPTTKRAKIDVVQSKNENYRYMFEKIKDKADSLDERIEYIAEQIERHYQLEGGFANPSRAHQDKIVAVGRICCDASEGKLNAQSILLESSRDLGMGKRVQLDVSRVEQYSLFPGQILGVEGVNNTGRLFVADKLLMPPLPPTLDRMDDDSSSITEPIDVIVSAGPFTFDDDLSYQPLERLIDTCIEQKPDIVVLMGPFVSENHPDIINATLDLTAEEIFQKQVTPHLSKLAQQCPGTQLVIIPHATDIVHEYPMIPQPPLSQSLLKLDNVLTLSNPAIIDINGVTLALENADIIMNISREEISNNASKDRLPRILTHLLKQHSFYPLFPYAQTDCIDSEQLPELQIPIKPDVLIAPSQLKIFTKVMDDVVCVNPGHLTKRHNCGTYARL